MVYDSYKGGMTSKEVLQNAFKRIALRNAEAMTGRRAPSVNRHLPPGERVYQQAMTFLEANRGKVELPHFFVEQNGVRRLVVNIPQSAAAAWYRTFSRRRGFIEPFFAGSVADAQIPSSLLRIGGRMWYQYGKGERHKTHTTSGRTAFPVALSEAELAETTRTLRNKKNAEWDESGQSGQNCTNWLTRVIRRFTEVDTLSVKIHKGQLVKGPHSDRMRVIAVMSERPIKNFDEKQLELPWYRGGK